MDGRGCTYIVVYEGIEDGDFCLSDFYHQGAVESYLFMHHRIIHTLNDHILWYQYGLKCKQKSASVKHARKEANQKQQSHLNLQNISTVV